MTKTMKGQGRKSSDIWTVFTSDVDPQKHNSAVCRHCKETVTYSHKTEQVIRHLNKKCAEFRKLMYQLSTRLGPDRVDKLVFIKFNHGQYVPIDQNEID